MWKHWVNQKILCNKWKQTDVNEKKFITEQVDYINKIVSASFIIIVLSLVYEFKGAKLIVKYKKLFSGMKKVVN